MALSKNTSIGELDSYCTAFKLTDFKLEKLRNGDWWIFAKHERGDIVISDPDLGSGLARFDICVELYSK